MATHCLQNTASADHKLINEDNLPKCHDSLYLNATESGLLLQTGLHTATSFYPTKAVVTEISDIVFACECLFPNLNFVISNTCPTSQNTLCSHI